MPRKRRSRRFRGLATTNHLDSFLIRLNDVQETYAHKVSLPQSHPLSQ